MFVKIEASLKNVSTQFEREPIPQMHKFLASENNNQVGYDVGFKKTAVNLKIFLLKLIKIILLNRTNIWPYKISNM